MPEFHVTFGSQYGDESYGADPHPVLGYEYAHRDGYLTIAAADEFAARRLIVRLIGTAWSAIYDAEDHAEDLHYYPRGELLRIVDPAAAPAIPTAAQITAATVADCLAIANEGHERAKAAGQ